MSDITAEAARKLKVVDLKAELQKRSLDTKGKKNELLTRLLEALGAVDDNISQDEESQGEEDVAADASEAAEADEPEPAPMDDGEPAPVNGANDDVAATDAHGAADEAMDESEAAAPAATEDATPAEDSEMQEEASKAGDDEKDAGTGSMQVLDEAVADERDLLEVPVQPEDRDPQLVVLDAYNSELNFRLESDGVTGSTQSAGGLFRLWGGARANWGAKSGRVFYHVTVKEGAAVEEEIFEPTGVRVGFSQASCQYCLGDEAASYGYSSEGQVIGDAEVRSYGCAFGVGDTVTCCLDLDSEERTISYRVNGEDQGVAFTLPASVEAGTPLFPHVEVKNLSVETKFDGEEAEFAAPEGYVTIGSLAEEAKTSGATGPKNAEEAEILMMVGLPGVGKTTWVNKYVAENAEKRFNVVGIDQIVQRMRVEGAEADPIKRWQTFAQVALDIQYKLLCLTEKRCRNYIMDQTNVFNSAQRRRMQPFVDYGRREAILLFTDKKTLAERTSQRERETGKIVPADSFFRMITSFVLPQEGRTFSAVTYVEEDATKSKELLQELQSDAQSSRSGGAKRTRYPQGSSSSGYSSRGYDDYRDRRGSYGGRDSRDYNSSRRDYGSSGSSSSGSGYRDRYGDRSYSGGGSSGYSRGSYSSDRYSSSSSYGSSSYGRPPPPPPSYGRRPPPAPPARYEPSPSSSSYGGGSRFDSRRDYSGSSGSSGYGRGGGSSGGSYGRSSYGGGSGSSYSSTPAGSNYSGGSSSSYQSGRYDSYSSGSTGSSYGGGRGGSSSYGASSGYRGGSSSSYGSSGGSSYSGSSSYSSTPAGGYGGSSAGSYGSSSSNSYGQSSSYGTSSSTGYSSGSYGGSTSGGGYGGASTGYSGGSSYSRGGAAAGGNQSYSAGGRYGAGSTGGSYGSSQGQGGYNKPGGSYGQGQQQQYGGYR